jgi:hypothetical protein
MYAIFWRVLNFILEGLKYLWINFTLPKYFHILWGKSGLVLLLCMSMCVAEGQIQGPHTC